MAEMLHINEDTFKTEVLDSSQPVLVDFSAVWCQPCKMLDPIVDEIASEYAGRLRVAKLDTDANPDVVMRYGVMGMPTLILFKNGEAVERMTGFKPKNKILDKLTTHL